MSGNAVQTVAPELIKQVRDANDLCSAAYNYFQKSTNLIQQSERVRASFRSRVTWGIILTILTSFAIIGILEAIYFGAMRSDASGITMFAIFCCFPLSAIFVILFSRLYFRTYARRPLKKVDALKKQAQGEQEKGEALFKTYHNIFAIIPEKYWFPAALGYILEMLQTGRSTTVNEALDRADEQLHRWKLEQNSNHALAVQIAQFETLKKIERNTFWDLI